MKAVGMLWSFSAREENREMFSKHWQKDILTVSLQDEKYLIFMHTFQSILDNLKCEVRLHDASFLCGSVNRCIKSPINADNYQHGTRLLKGTDMIYTFVLIL